METAELVTKISKTLKRADGSEVKIVAEAFFGRGLARSIGVYVHRRVSPEHDWVLCSDRPHPDWKTMSRDDYIHHGRSEMLQMVSHGEILKAASAIGKPLSCFA